MNTDPRHLRPILILAGIAVLAVMGAGIVLFNGGFFDGDRGELVIIEADPTAIKIRPDDRGGLEIDNLDSPVLGLLDEKPDNATTPEVLTPQADTPEPPPISVDVPAPLSQTTPPPQQNIETIDDAIGAIAETTPDSEATQALPQALKKTLTAPAVVVQFAAFKNEQGALQTAALLGQKHKARLDGLTIGYMRYNDFWIVITDPLPQAQARALHQKFMAIGQDSFVRSLELP